MTKRKRTPSSSPPPRKRRVSFEVPTSIWSFQAIARELARQSELLVKQTEENQDNQSSDSQRAAPGAPLFDAQTFQLSALRFSPYSQGHQPFLPSQPWPQTVKPSEASPDFDSYPTGSTIGLAPRSEGGRQELDTRQISTGPDDQLFDELNDALHADQDEDGAVVPSSSTQYVSETDRTRFDPQSSSDWHPMRPEQEQYQSFMHNYQQMTMPTTYPDFLPSAATLAHHPPRTSFLPNSSISQPQPQAQSTHSFYHARPPPPQTDARAKSNVPGYYKSSLKLWSQEDHQSVPRTSSSQAIPRFASPGNPYSQIAYSGNTNYHPPVPPPPLASSAMATFANYGNTR